MKLHWARIASISALSFVLCLAGAPVIAYESSALEREALKQARTIKLHVSLFSLSNESEISQSLMENDRETYEAALEDFISSRYDLAESKMEKLKQEAAFSDGAGLYLLGCACFCNGHYKKATEYLQQAAKLKPDDVLVRVVLASSFYWLGDYESSDQCLREALALSVEVKPRNVQAINDQIAILTKLSSSASFNWQFEESAQYRDQAENLLDDLLKTDRANLDTRLRKFELASGLAGRLFSQHRYAAALPIYQKALVDLKSLEAVPHNRLWLLIRKLDILQEMVACAQVMNTDSGEEQLLPGLSVEADNENMLPPYKTLSSIRTVKLLYSPYIIGKRFKTADAGMAEARYTSMKIAKEANPEAAVLPLTALTQLKSYSYAEYDLGNKAKARKLNREAQAMYEDLLKQDLKSLALEARRGYILVLKDAIKFELAAANISEAKRLMTKAIELNHGLLDLTNSRGEAQFQFAFLADGLLNYPRAIGTRERGALIESALGAIRETLKVSPEHAGAKMSYMNLLTKKAYYLMQIKEIVSADQAFEMAQKIGSQLISSESDNLIVCTNMTYICWSRARLAKSRGEKDKALEATMELIAVCRKLQMGRYYNDFARRNLEKAQWYLGEIGKLKKKRIAH